MNTWYYYLIINANQLCAYMYIYIYICLLTLPRPSYFTQAFEASGWVLELKAHTHAQGAERDVCLGYSEP